MSKEIVLGDNKISISLKVKDLVNLGMMVGDVENNANVLGQILGGINSGDILALLDVLKQLSPKGVADKAVDEMVENAPAEDVEKAYTEVADFFEKSPLTSKQAKTINKAMKEQMAKALEKGVQVEKN